MDVPKKLQILTDSAKYDVACTSSKAARTAAPGGIGSALLGGCCHSFTADGRCVSLLKVLMGNACVYDCKYCVNRRSNDIPRAVFEPRELALLTMEFYRRNYIEGLFLSSAVIKDPDHTVELIVRTLSILRREYRFYGYIHAKAIPGASNALHEQLGLLADRISVNIELPSEASLRLLAPDKSKRAVLGPMDFIKNRAAENSHELTVYKNVPRFAPAGQSTQMIIGASPETDRQILKLTEGLYQKFRLKRVFFSAYLPMVADSDLPAVGAKPPLLREHRLYQADWLLRHYNFTADEILDERQPDFNPFLDPKCNWAVNHPEFFPVDVNRARYAELLRVPGIGVVSARRIVAARKSASLDLAALRKIGVAIKRAQYFIVCRDKARQILPARPEMLLPFIMSPQEMKLYRRQENFGQRQLELFDRESAGEEGWGKCIAGKT
ncbi:MAG: putative DNA modification/repair radical SAM protein [Acidaminococcales bacterium]|nr:putative DNA modification/repair radical SAM protein [Acidaminococcales bacterium]